MNYCLKYLLFIQALGILSSVALAGPKTSDTVSLYFSGSRLSNLEPCGCSPSQESGLQYENAITEHSDAAVTLKMDAGNWTNIRSELGALDVLKTGYLLRALSAMNYDAINFGLNEASLNLHFFDPLKNDCPQLRDRIVSANVFTDEKLTHYAFVPGRVIERTVAGRKLRVAVIGLVEPVAVMTSGSLKTENRGVSDTLKVNDYWICKPELGLGRVLPGLKAKADAVVLLLAGSRNLAEKITVAYPALDLIVVSQLGYGLEIGQSGPSRSKIVPVRKFKGVEIGEVTFSATGGLHDRTLNYHTVDKKLAVSRDIQDLLGRFKAETRSLVSVLPGPNVEKKYASANLCINCHRQAYYHWKDSKHALAMQTLVERGQQFNPECLKCHTTSFRKDNGFYSALHYPSTTMADVQCEVCHGPARAHVDDEVTILAGGEYWLAPAEYKKLREHARRVLPAKEVPARVCESCHNAETDKQFKYDQKVVKVNHKVVKVNHLVARN